MNRKRNIAYRGYAAIAFGKSGDADDFSDIGSDVVRTCRQVRRVSFVQSLKERFIVAIANQWLRVTAEIARWR